MQTFYIILANAVVALHVGYVSFVVLGLAAIMLGGVFGWRWVRNRWFRIAHLAAITIVALETAIGMTCPLTTWENNLRAWGGQHTLEGDWIANILRHLIFLPIPDDHWIFKVLYFGFGGLVLAVLLLVPPRWSRQSAPAEKAPPTAQQAVVGETDTMRDKVPS